MDWTSGWPPNHCKIVIRRAQESRSLPVSTTPFLALLSPEGWIQIQSKSLLLEVLVSVGAVHKSRPKQKDDQIMFPILWHGLEYLVYACKPYIFIWGLFIGGYRIQRIRPMQLWCMLSLLGVLHIFVGEWNEPLQALWIIPVLRSHCIWNGTSGFQ